MRLQKLGLLSAWPSFATAQTVYLIRHGEKPKNGAEGLSSDGEERAQCLRTVFGASSEYDVGYIIAEQPLSNGKRRRPLETVTPLAADLGLHVDTSCDRDDADCVNDLVQAYVSDGSGQNVLICWEHDALPDIVKALGAKKAPDYPEDSYDIIWKDPAPYSKATKKTSEDCAGLDS